MKMTVLGVSFPFAPVGPRCVGGAEQILTELDRALTAAGHTSLVVACEGSNPAGKLFPVPRFESYEDSDRREWRREQVRAVVDSALRTHAVDLIHVHDMEFYRYRFPADIPVLVTLHLPVSWYPPDVWEDLPENLLLQFVSETQRLSSPPALRVAPVIPNGVEVSVPMEQKRRFAIVLGRICPEKNQHEALEAGFAARIPVVLGGKVFPWPEHQRYFDEKVQPLLRRSENGIRHELHAPLEPEKKQSLLAQAQCLLHSTLAPETSSLVAMEALAAGTPVIAYRSGALPEIVQDGVTGFVVDSMEAMAAAIDRVHTIRPETCRAEAVRRFSKERMIAQYFDLYAQFIVQSLPTRATHDTLPNIHWHNSHF